MIKVLITTVVLTHETSSVNTIVVEFETKSEANAAAAQLNHRNYIHSSVFREAIVLTT